MGAGITSGAPNTFENPCNPCEHLYKFAPKSFSAAETHGQGIPLCHRLADVGGCCHGGPTAPSLALSFYYKPQTRVTPRSCGPYSPPGRLKDSQRLSSPRRGFRFSRLGQILRMLHLLSVGAELSSKQLSPAKLSFHSYVAGVAVEAGTPPETGRKTCARGIAN